MKRLGLFKSGTLKRESQQASERATIDPSEGGDTQPQEQADLSRTRSGGFNGRPAPEQARYAPAGFAPVRRGAGGSQSVAQVTSVIGWLCGTGRDDWETALRLCDDISTSTDLSKEAARALRKEIEHGQPEPQERAARLIVIMSRNAGDRFRLQLAQKKFLDAVEKTLKSNKTSEPVRNMLIKALSVLAFEHQADRDLAPLVGLYNKVKRPEDPFNGSEIDSEDPVFSPTELPQRHRTRRPHHPGPADLAREAQAAKSNASMLSEALSFTKPEDMDSNELITEFYTKCQESQSHLVDAIPWATTKADEVRQRRGETQPMQPGDMPQSPEEELLGSLLAAQQDLVGVFHMHDDMQRKRREELEEREARQRSMTDTRYDRAAESLQIPTNGIWSSGSSENLARAGSSREGSRRGSTQEERPLPEPIAASPPRQPLAPPRSTNPYAPRTDTPPQPFDAPYQSPPKAFNPFMRQQLPAGAGSPYRDQETNGYVAPAPQPTTLPYVPSQPAFANTFVEEPDLAQHANYPALSNSTRAPPRSPSAGFNPYLSKHQPQGSTASTATSRSSTNPYYTSKGPSLSSSQQPRPSTAGTDDDSLVTPIEPSAKALGKLRRMSMRDDADADDLDERQHALEDKLREKYRLHAEQKQSMAQA